MKRHPFRGICEATGKPLRDADKVLDEMEEVVGPNRREAEAALGKKLGETALKRMHIHVSGVEYNAKGEMKHLNLDESDFRYDDWVQALKDAGVEGTVICESPIQERDALILKSLYLS